MMMDYYTLVHPEGTRPTGAAQVLRAAWVSLVALIGAGQQLVAQGRRIDVSYGTWRRDTAATVWSLGFVRPLVGPVDYGIALAHLSDRRSLLDRTQTGGELSVGVGRDASGFYAVAATGLAMRHDDGHIDVNWSAGAGLAARVLPFVSVGIEARYRVEDQFHRGFWRLDPTDRRGLVIMGRATLVRRARSRATSRPRSTGRIERKARESGLSRSELAAQIVSTALDAMGTPYRWGGGNANG